MSRFGGILAESTPSVSRFGGIPADAAPQSAPADKPTELADAAVTDPSAPPVSPEPELPTMQSLQRLYTVNKKYPTPENQAALEQERTRLQAKYEIDNRSFIASSLPVRAAESSAKGIRSGVTGLVAETASGAANLIGRKELSESLHGVAKRVSEQAASEDFIQGELDKNSLIGATAAGWTRAGTQAIAESYLAGGLSRGVVGLASYYGAKSTAEQITKGKSFSQAATHGLIEGAATIAGGELLGAGTGMLAGTAHRFSETAASKAAAYIVQRSAGKLSKNAAEIVSSGGGEVLEEVGTEVAHYIADVGFGEKFDVKELIRRAKAAAGPAAFSGVGGKALHSAINKYSSDIGKVRADIRNLPNSPAEESVIESAEKALPDPPAETVAQDAPGPTPAAQVDPNQPDAAVTPPDAAQSVTEGVTPEAPIEATSARKEWMNQDRESLGLDELPTPDSRPWEVALDTAKQNGVPGRAVDLSNEVLAKPRAFSDVETAGIVVRAAELKNQHKELHSQLQSTTDPSDIAVRAAELNRLEGEFDTISRGLRTSGTEKGRALAAQKLTIGEDTDILSVRTRAKASKGDVLTPQEDAKFEDLSDKAEKTKTRSQNLDKEIQQRDQARQHREVGRLTSAVKNIRQQLGLDARSEASTDVPGLTTEDKAQLAKLDEKLKAADAALANVKEVQLGERVHNRPSEQEVSDLDNEITRILGDIRRKTPKKVKDSVSIEQKKTESLAKRLTEAQENLRKARAGEQIPPKDRRADVMSEERAKLDYELAKTRRDIRQAITAVKPKSLWSRAQNLTDFSRGLITSTDYSAVGRQAKFAAWSHPIVAAKALPTMFKAGWSDRMAFKAEQDIQARPNARLYDLGMTIHRQDSKLTDREENYASKALDHIPFVAGSQRAYVAFINQMRADTFDLLAKTHGGKQGLTQAEYKQLGHLINVNTGRGGFAAADQHMRTASLALFAPRFALARIQYAIGEPAWHSSNRVRRIVAEEYARSFIGAAAWYGLYAAAWGDDERFSITFDPRSTDFGKIVLGNVRIDPMAGMAQWGRFVTQTVLGQKIENGRVKKLTGRDKWNNISRFTRSKLSPILGTAANVMSEEDVMGHPVNVTSVEGAKNLAMGTAVPLSLHDIIPAIQDQGLSRGTAMAICGAFGEGLQVYDIRHK